MKKLTSLLLTLALILTMIPMVSAAGLSAFERSRTYEGQFADVDANSPLASNIQAVYEMNLMNGVSDTAFAPSGNLSYAQTYVIAARIRSAYAGDDVDLTAAEGEEWFRPAYRYALEREMVPASEMPLAEPIDRKMFAAIMYTTIAKKEFQHINVVEDWAIPDVDDPTGVDKCVYEMYRAGILTGSDEKGTFYPLSHITRGAAAAILTRLVDPSMRRNFGPLEKQPFELVPLNELQNLKSLRRKASDAEMEQAYDAAKEVVLPLVDLPREEQLMGIAVALREIFERSGTYTTETPHYNDPYGFFIEGVASCAGCTRATGLCLNMLGIPYEHVNENQWAHQWCRVPVGDTYYICDAFGLTCGPEPAPYQHPYF